MVGPVFPGRTNDTGFSGHARDRILRAAAAAFSERGFHGVKVRDLAEQAQVNLAAVNYHFRSKEELYVAVIDSALELWLAETVVLDDLDESASLSEVVALLISALIAPVIEREEAPLLPRLIAWDLLQGAGTRRIGASPAITAAVRNRLARHLPESLERRTLDLVTDWLVSQCLLLAPSLSARPGEAAQDYSKMRDLAGEISALALNGLAGLLRGHT